MALLPPSWRGPGSSRFARADARLALSKGHVRLPGLDQSFQNPSKRSERSSVYRIVLTSDDAKTIPGHALAPATAMLTDEQRNQVRDIVRLIPADERAAFLDMLAHELRGRELAEG